MAIRALAGLISEFGLLSPRDICHLPRVLDAWDRTLGRGSLPPQIHLTQVEIEFVGLFDSVMGGFEQLPLFNPVRFSNSMMPGRCKNGIQILAIDENRNLFKPKSWECAQPGRDAQGHRTDERFLRQIWMPGVHADIGGTGNSLWGSASLLAMTFYLRERTNLRLDSEWIGQKEADFRSGFYGALQIRPHRGLFTNHHRQPVRAKGAKERRHPICALRELHRLNYDGARDFNWYEQVFLRHFDRVSVDKDLVDYFRRVLKPRQSPARGPDQSPTSAFNWKDNASERSSQQPHLRAVDVDDRAAG